MRAWTGSAASGTGSAASGRGSAASGRGAARSSRPAVIVYGRNPVREAERGPRRVLRTWEGLPAEELERICGSPDHQGVCAQVEPYRYADPAGLLDAADALVVALDEVQDPHNLGAVCRVAEVAGAAGVVIPERRSAEVTPAVCKASAGAVEHLAVARVRNLADWLGEAKQAGAWIYGADAAGIPYDRPDYGGKVVLVLGAEEKGLRPRVATACDELIALPVRGRVESLNVSTAAAALVYGILQFRVQS
jgi:23S rRNA (guanosine2251-2'-O)-methyltransferase